jgi:peptide/nickel transport system substrate-binding protein
MLAVGLLVACGSNPPASQPRSESGEQPVASPPQRTLVIIARGEPPTIAAKSLQAYSASIAAPIRPFNAMLDYTDEKEGIQPYLAEAIPQLNTDTWRVFPDGRMETTYRLRPNLTWHDGRPLTGDDFVFAWRVFATPELGVSASDPIAQMAEVASPDPRTVVFRWKQTYADAAGFDMTFHALPRHLLEGPFQQLDAVAFSNHSFWTQDYVGLGPYRLTGWTPGASIEGAAFDGHALGKPKIDRIRFTFTADANSALASMLSGEAHHVSDFVLFYEEAAELEQEWTSRGIPGLVLYAPITMRPTGVQMRPEFANPRALLDVRVRKALAHGLNIPVAIETTTGGRGLLSYSLTSPKVDYYPAIEPSVEKHPYDPRAMARLLEEAGMVRGADGFYAMANGEPFRPEVATDGGQSNERENIIWVDDLRKNGVDASAKVIPVAQLRDPQARAQLPGLQTGGIGSKALSQMTSAATPRVENRWSGNNRGGWSNAEFDRTYQAFTTTLERSERVAQVAKMEKILSEEVGIIPTYFTIVANAHVAALKGPMMRTTPDSGQGILHIERWEWAS